MIDIHVSPEIHLLSERIVKHNHKLTKRKLPAIQLKCLKYYSNL